MRDEAARIETMAAVLYDANMENCVFCKIVAGDIPSHTVYENDRFLAFLDIRPLNPGHTLVIPKEHFRWVWDCPYIGAYMETAQLIANAQRDVFDTEQVVSLIFGEEVPHAHIWLVPRLPNDGHGGAIDLSNHKNVSDDQMRDIAERLRAATRANR